MALTMATVNIDLRSATSTTLATGSVYFSAPYDLYDTSGHIVWGKGTKAATITAGIGSISLPVNDGAGITPSGWAWSVTIDTDTVRSRYDWLLTTAMGSPVNFADTGPAVTPPTLVTYALDSALTARTGLAVNLQSLGVTSSTTDIHAALVTAAAAAGHVIVPALDGPLHLATRWDGTDVWLDFEPGASISFDMDTRAMDLVRCRLTNASFTSSRTGPTSAADNSPSGHYVSNAREVRLGDGCEVDGYYHEYAAAGLNVTAGAHVRIRNASFANLRHMTGWAAAIHCSGTSTFDIQGDGIHIESCDRGIEVEDGARDAWFNGVWQKNVYPTGYSGQPGDYAAYTFTVGAHSHQDGGACTNIHFRDVYLENCGGGPSFILSTGTNATDMPRNCSVEDVRIVGSAMSAGYEMIGLQGYNNVVRKVIMQVGAGVTSKMLAQFYGNNSENCRLEDVRAESFALPLVKVDANSVGNVIANIRPGTVATGSGYLFDIQGRYTTLRDCSIFGVTGTTGYVKFASTADYSRIVGMNYNLDTGETFTTAVLVDGSDHVEITSLQASNFASSPPKELQINNPSTYVVMHHCNIDRSTGTSISLGSSTAKCRIHSNTFSAAATISAGGTDHVLSPNQFSANWSDPTVTLEDFESTVGINPAVMALVQSGGSVTHPTTNQAILVKRTARRALAITKLVWQVGVQSGNYDMAIYDSAGTRLWSKGSTAVPASGVVTETVTGASVVRGAVYYVAIAFDNTTVSYKGVTLTATEAFKNLLGDPVSLAVGSSFPLPTPITPGSTAAARLPGITVREA